MSSLEVLMDRAEISDVLHRYARAIDTRDWTLLATCFAPDVEADFRSFGGKEVVRGRDRWVEAVRQTIQGLDATQHLTGNHTHDVRGDEATLTAYVQASHWLQNPRGDAEYTVGGTYDCDLVRTPDGWRIRRYRLTVAWHRGNRDILRLAQKALRGEGQGR